MNYADTNQQTNDCYERAYTNEKDVKSDANCKLRRGLGSLIRAKDDFNATSGHRSPHVPKGERGKKCTQQSERDQHHNGILSCFFHGLLSSFPRSLRSPKAILRRVEWG